MQIAQLSDQALELRRDGASPLVLPFLWLRDNCSSAFDLQTKERNFDLLSVPDDLKPAGADIQNGTLVITWPDGHVSRFEQDWLSAHRPGAPRPDAAALPRKVWRAADMPELPRFSGAEILASDKALFDFLVTTQSLGLCLVDGLAPGQGLEVAQRIGFLRETNFGKVFDVVSKPDPNNLAYTAQALALHTDLANQEIPPGFQFLHCIANEAQGGGSIFADSFAIAEDLRATDHEAFRVLSTAALPFRFHDKAYDIRLRRPVITLHPDGSLDEIRYNAHLTDLIDLPANQLGAFYRAYRAFMRRTRDPAFVITTRLRGGEMVVFDNRRTLHGREAFNPATGFRQLQGCYVDRGEFESRIRVLDRQGDETFL
ncbi:TauD/TfdA family dioxygenase [Labrys neptuniae]